jgi:hypothetical protein
VIGDKMGGRTRARIERDPAELTELARRVRAPLRILHVTRNPYDCVARRVAITKNGLTLPEAIDNFGRSVRTIDDILIATGDTRLLTVRHESLVRSPKVELARVCRFLGVDSDDAYLDDCASIVFSTPQTARHRVEWTRTDRAAVQRIIDRHEFLAGYSWTSSA